MHAHYYEIAGVFTFLCPPCRTDLQGYLLDDVGFHDWWVAKARMNQTLADPLMMGSVADTMAEAEGTVFRKCVAWIRSPKPGSPLDPLRLVMPPVNDNP